MTQKTKKNKKGISENCGNPGLATKFNVAKQTKKQKKTKKTKKELVRTPVPVNRFTGSG